VLLAGLLVVVAACGDDQQAASDAEADVSEPAEQSVTPDGTDGTDQIVVDPADAGSADESAVASPTVRVLFLGESYTGSVDGDNIFSCLVTGSTFTFEFVDGDGNDLAASYEGQGTGSVTLTFADGSSWDRADGGFINGATNGDGDASMNALLEEISTGEQQPFDAVLDC
jgi:hypothetical protein